MSYSAGFRTATTFTSVTDVVLDEHGSYLQIEVTNKGASDITVTINDYPEQGHSGANIPVSAGTTRVIPMMVMKFTASGPVDVVAYRM